MKPFQIFRKKFEESYLQEVFEKKVSKTKAVGKDGVTVSRFSKIVSDEISIISKKVSNGSYKFTNYKGKLISKGAYKPPRVLSIPTIRDRITLRSLCDFLAEIYPEAITRKPHEYIKRIKENLRDVRPGAAFLRIDVREYYPSVDRDLLIKDIKKKIRKSESVALIEKAISTKTFIDENKGVPQGLSVSNILANIYLLDFDEEMNAKYVYYRYVDDMLIICDSLARAHDVYDEISFRLKHERGLVCHKIEDKGKSYMSLVGQGIEYLGFHISRKGREPYVSIRDSSMKKMMSSIMSIFSRFKSDRNSIKLMWKLNLKITGCRFEGKNYGWMFFFLQTDDIKQLARLDNLVKKAMISNGKSNLVGRQKTFVKAYHEIRFKGSETKYIPDFNNISIDYMVEILKIFSHLNENEINLMSDSDITREFVIIIRKEISDLERDVLESFS